MILFSSVYFILATYEPDFGEAGCIDHYIMMFS